MTTQETLANGLADTVAQPTLHQVLQHPIPHINIVDVGAMSEGNERYHELIAAGMATVTGFEPNSEQYAKLQGRPGPYRYIQAFLGNGENAEFKITRYPGCCSLFHPDPRVIDLFETIGCAQPGGNFHVQRCEPVSTTRLDDLGSELFFDYLKLDIQGAELDVLRNGVDKLRAATVIETEVEFLPLYKDQPLFGDIQCFLREQGFVLHKLIDCAGRPFRPLRPRNPFVPMSQLLWADAIFVRDFTRLETYTDESLVKAAAILDIVYHSYDLAAFLLAEFDRRRYTALEPRYLNALSVRRLSTKCLNIKQHP